MPTSCQSSSFLLEEVVLPFPFFLSSTLAFNSLECGIPVFSVDFIEFVFVDFLETDLYNLARISNIHFSPSSPLDTFCAFGKVDVDEELPLLSFVLVGAVESFVVPFDVPKALVPEVVVPNENVGVLLLLVDANPPPNDPNPDVVLAVPFVPEELTEPKPNDDFVAPLAVILPKPDGAPLPNTDDDDGVLDVEVEGCGLENVKVLLLENIPSLSFACLLLDVVFAADKAIAANGFSC